MAKISVVIGQSHSLKDKRMVVRRIKDRVRDKLGISINEVGELDIWQRAELGCAVTSGERRKALELLDEVIRIVVATDGAEVVAVAKDAITFSGSTVPVSVDDRTGSGDKAVAQDGWIPDEWKDHP